MKLLKSAAISLSCLLVPVLAHAAPVCPALSGASSAYYAAIPAAGTNCNTVITINANGTLTFTEPNSHPYDGNDDNYVGVINNYTGSVSALTLTGSNNIFGFDGDGIDAFGAGSNAIDAAKYGSTAYGGADAFFTAINSTGQSGTVNFLGGLASGSTGYFSLEAPPSGGNSIGGGIVPTVPEPSSLVLLGTGALSLAGIIRRRLKV